MHGDCREVPGVPVSLLPNQQSLNEEDVAIAPHGFMRKMNFDSLGLMLGLSFFCVCSQSHSDPSGLHTFFSEIPPLSQLRLLSDDCSDLCLLGSPPGTHQETICHPEHSHPLVHPQPNQDLTHSA